MRRIQILPLLLAALLLFACGSPVQDGTSHGIGQDDVVVTVGSESVNAIVYRYQLAERLRTIKEHGLDDRDVYLSYIANPNISYVYAYYDTRTEEGVRALAEDLCNELALEAAAIDAGTKAGYRLTAQEQSYLYQAEENAQEALSALLQENGGAYESIEAFFAETGFTESLFTGMYTHSMQASILFNHLLEDYRAAHTLSEDEIRTGYARIVQETFRDRYTAGVYTQYLAYYLAGSRSFPSLYIPDDAIFVRLFVMTDPTDDDRAAIAQQAEADFDALYASEQNEFTVHGTAGDLAVAPGDELVDGLYEAAKTVAVGSVGSMEREQDGKTICYWFLRVAGETGTVSIDRYPGVRERIVSQLLGTACMDTLRAAVSDPATTTRNDDLIDWIIASQIGA